MESALFQDVRYNFRLFPRHRIVATIKLGGFYKGTFNGSGTIVGAYDNTACENSGLLYCMSMTPRLILGGRGPAGWHEEGRAPDAVNLDLREARAQAACSHGNLRRFVMSQLHESLEHA